jgi:glutathione S-transferase
VKLYYLSGACSLSAHIALYESKIEFDAVSVDLQSRMTSEGEAYDKINSKGYVPALQLENGELLTEVVAVLQYIADRDPSSKLAPALGTMERYRLMEWLSFINSEIHKSFSPLFSPIASEETKQFTRNRLQKRMDWLEGAIGIKAHLLGDHFTIADAYLFTVLNWFGMAGMNLAEWPNLKRYHKGVGSRPKVQQAIKTEGSPGFCAPLPVI